MIVVYYSHHIPGWGACESIREYDNLDDANKNVVDVNDENDPYMVCRLLDLTTERDLEKYERLKG